MFIVKDLLQIIRNAKFFLQHINTFYIYLTLR